jgi:N-acetylneuraminic acid mutarotase
LLPNGKVLVAGGLGPTGGLAEAEVYDPVGFSWTTTQPMNTARRYHTATLLPDGQVLVAAGFNDNTLEVNTAELYNPTNNAWVPAASMNAARQVHTATLLASGRVLVAGGYKGDSLSTSEVYDYANGTWTVTDSLKNGRQSHTATLLPTGKVLLAGGYGTNLLSTAELYDPVSQSFALTGSLNNGRWAHTATLLANGQVLVAGGFLESTAFYATNSVELYDPTTGKWTLTAPMNLPRGFHTATLLPSGKVLVTGGYTTGRNQTNSAELYDPPSGTWSFTGSMTVPTYLHTATLLPSGKILVVGGENGCNFGQGLSEVYDPFTGNWTNFQNGLFSGSLYQHTATLLPNGKVLVAGGDPCLVDTNALSGAYLYDPGANTWTTTASLGTARKSHAAVLLLNGKVLVTGGQITSSGFYVTTNAAELYDPSTSSGLWTSTASMNVARQFHTATLLPDGRVLVAGGVSNGYGLTSSAELYDPGLGFANSWRPQVTALTSPFVLGTGLALTGSGFRGSSEASGANNSQDSPSDYPVMQLRSLANEQTVFLVGTNWSTDSVVSVPVNGLPPAWTLLTVFVNGIPSQSAIFRLVPAATAIVLNIPAQLPGGAVQVSFTNVSGAVFTALATTNISLPTSNWTVLGSATEVADGLFQFTDVQATNFSSRLYRVRSP